MTIQKLYCDRCKREESKDLPIWKKQVLVNDKEKDLCQKCYDSLVFILKNFMEHTECPELVYHNKE